MFPLTPGAGGRVVVVVVVVFAHVGVIQVVTWGHPDYGADSSNVELKNVVQVQVPWCPSLGSFGPCSKLHITQIQGENPAGWALSAGFFGGWVGGLHPPPRSLTVRP